MHSTTDAETYMLDSNVLVYAFDNGTELHHKLAGDLLENLLEGTFKAAVSTQILSEFLVTVTAERKQAVVNSPMSVQEAQGIIEDLLTIRHLKVFDLKPEHCRRCPLNYPQRPVTWDCLIAAVMKANNVSLIYTWDKDFQKIDCINALNPSSHPT